MDDELKRFLGEWKHQLETEKKTRVSPSLSRGGLQSDNEELLGKRNDRNESPSVLPDVKRQAREPSPLLVLPNVEDSCRNTSELKVTNKSAPKNKTETLVDTLIADLNELNTIPFFDVQLPREIAISIFRFLDVKDLCVCARVSKSWRALAEDNMLWNAICQSLGYRGENDSDHEEIQWKSVAMKAVVQRRRVVNNWRERICGLNDLRPDTTGRICCSVYNQNHVLFCCSSGEAYIWDVREDWGPVELQQSHYVGTPTCCAFSDSWAVVGTSSGELKVMDTQTRTQLHSVEAAGHTTSVILTTAMDSITIVACADSTSTEPAHSNVIIVKSEGGEDWRTFYLDTPRTKVCKLGLLPHSRLSSLVNYDVIYSTQTTLAVQAVGSPSSTATHLLTSEGEVGSSHINTFDHTPQTVACATSSHGYHVQLFDLSTGVHLTTLKGHSQPVTAINIRQSPPHYLVTGSADKRVCVYNYAQSSQPVMKLHGHADVVKSVQMDEWKVVSASADGAVIVWDQRMQSELWRLTERYSVGLCQFDETFLVIGHICLDPLPPAYHFNLHQRQKGLLRILDFSVDPRHYTTLLPSICSSTYNEPSASFYNLDLMYPYDSIGQL